MRLWDMVASGTSIFPVSIIPKMLHTPRHLVVLSREINGRSLRTSIKEMVFKILQRKTFISTLHCRLNTTTATSHSHRLSYGT